MDEPVDLARYRERRQVRRAAACALFALTVWAAFGYLERARAIIVWGATGALDLLSEEEPVHG